MSDIQDDELYLEKIMARVCAWFCREWTFPWWLYTCRLLIVHGFGWVDDHSEELQNLPLEMNIQQMRMLLQMRRKRQVWKEKSPRQSCWNLFHVNVLPQCRQIFNRLQKINSETDPSVRRSRRIMTSDSAFTPKVLMEENSQL